MVFLQREQGKLAVGELTGIVREAEPGAQVWRARPARDTWGHSGQRREELEDGYACAVDECEEEIRDPSFREKDAVESTSGSVTPGLADAEGTQGV